MKILIGFLLGALSSASVFAAPQHAAMKLDSLVVNELKSNGETSDESAAARAWFDKGFGTDAGHAPSSGVPFSFVYGGVPSSSLLPGWKTKVVSEKAAGPGTRRVDPYGFRSMATTGLAICPDLNRNKDQIPQVRRMMEESKSLRPLALGDYYPLTEINSSEQNWCAWQYDRPDLAQGYVMVFRRSKSPFVSARLALHGLDPGADYVLTNADTRESKTVNGAVLAGGYPIDLTKPATNLFLTYRKSGQK